MQHVASIPAEVFEHVRRSEGAEAAGDIQHVIKTSKKLGIDCETGGKK